MTLRPLRPLQSARRVDDGHDNCSSNNNNNNHNSSNKNGGPLETSRKLGPIATPVVLPMTKRATCSQCRVRKVRCDGREGICQNCARLGFECSFQQSPSKSSGPYVLVSPERRRRMQACLHCHLKKTRCHGELPRCSNCVRRGRECTYPAARRQGTGTSAAASDSNSSSATPGETPVSQGPKTIDRDSSSSSATARVYGTSLEDIGTVVEHIEGYFDHLYPLPSFAFLHKSTVIRRCRDGTINEPLKFAICAVTSLHLQRTSLYHNLWAQKAEQLILQHISRPSIFHLQALLLVVRYRIESGEFPTAFMLASLAARTAVALRLNYERAELAPVAQEARRRLYWALYLLDDYFCVGLREFELCPEETIYLQLPCREEIFGAGQHYQTGLLQPSASDNVTAMGLRGAFIRLTSARRAVMRFNRHVGLGEESSSTVGGRIRQFEQELARLQAALGPEHQYSVSNLASCRWPAQFAMLHMSYYQCHCDIYRMFLNGYSEAAPSGLLASISTQDRLTMQAQCLEHAESIIRILRDFLGQFPPGSPDRLLERDAAVCAFESARLVMFGARLPCATSTPSESVHKARAVSLRFITRFFPYSASTRPLRTALEHLISSYTSRQAAEAQPQARGALSEPEPATPQTSSKVSRYANSRQRLSVQSLLLQSDFADDSHEIAGPAAAAAAPPPSSVSSSSSSSLSASSFQNTAGAVNHHQEEPMYPPAFPQTGVDPHPALAAIDEEEEGEEGRTAGDTAAPLSSSSGIIPTVPIARNTTLGALALVSSGDHNTNQQSQSQPPFHPSTSRPPSSSSPWGVTIDAGREDAGLIFNPWMGFTGPEDFYGVLEGLSEDY
ncbi:putative fungal transcription factor regulatory middle homology region [Rosellinia necatrix]|uniref:Putative fungal transcription factor regulatory middle homology region n=1 Tax=Rosellinia necatrix TaxID=77044 RepID=A0A1W2TIU8_ROSNE|nr:putative fungal transcription factor regulatory middle homology region [Rosellinia necatrix]